MFPKFLCWNPLLAFPNVKFSQCVCGKMLPIYNMMQFWGTSRMSGNLTQFWHDVSGDSIRLHGLRAQSYKSYKTIHQSLLQVPLQAPGHYMCFRTICYRLEILTTSFLGSFSLLERLTELRVTCLPVYYGIW